MRLAERAFQAGYRLHSHDTIGSTNAEALSCACAGDPGRLWVTARVQTAGRGRRGRGWSSPLGNLHASLLLVEAAPPALSPQLAFVGAVALFDAVVAVLPVDRRLCIKWPNDLLVDGAKVAGILVEGTRLPNGRAALVIGFGVNCGSHPDGLPYRTIDLGVAAGRPVEPQALLAGLSETMLDALASWQGGPGFDDVRRRWLARATPLGTALTVSGRDARMAGIFAGIDPEGRLLLRTETGEQTIDVGDVALEGERRPHAADPVS